MTKQFFEKVLPTQGNLCVLGIIDGVIKPKWAEDIDGLMKLIDEFDKGNYNTFFALGTFEGLQRKANECMFMRSFFVDIDCGKGKPYPEWEKGLFALHKFVDDTGLPKPIIVNSGHGIHAYWPFNEEVPVDIWKPYALALLGLCADRAFLVDSVVTADAARVLRAPGSRNLKDINDPLPVAVIQDAEPTDFDELTKLFGEVKPLFNIANVEKGLDEDTKAIYEKYNNNFEYNFATIAEKSLEDNGCDQIKNIIINAASLPEPLWYAGLSVASRCNDGATAIHLLSEDHPDYDYDNTERKAEQARTAANWAFGCESFDKLNPGVCANCAFRGTISGPIVLGKVLRTAEQPPAEHTEDAVREENNEIFFPDFLQPFFRGVNGGIYYMPPPRHIKNGKTVQDDPELITPFDIYPTQRVFSTHDGECMLMQIDFPKDASREFLLPMKEIGAIDKLKAALFSQGLKFEPVNAPKLASYLMKWATYLTNIKRADIMRHQQGWTTEEHESYVIGTTEYCRDGSERYTPPSPLAKNVVRHIGQKGSLEEWKKIMKLYNDPGYEIHAFTVLCGFASPLVEFMNVNGMALVLCGGSGAGKSGALFGAMSIWGHPENLSVFDATGNALMNRMVISKNNPYGLDEQSNTDGKVISHLMYNISNGQPRLRLNLLGQEREQAFITKLIGIITTNTDPKDLMEMFKGDTNAEQLRYFQPDIVKPMVPGYELTAERGIEMFDNLKFNYGYAGPVFIKEVLRIGPEHFTNRLRSRYLNMGAKFTTNAEYRYLSNMFAGCEEAGNICNSLGLLDWDIDRILSVAGKEYEKFIAGKTYEQVNKAESMLGDFINRNIKNALIMRDNKWVSEPNLALYITANVDDNVMWISCSAIKDYLKLQRLAPKWFETELEKQGILKEKVKKQMAAGWKTAFGSTNVYAYRIEMPIQHLFNDETPAT